jgi:hypothetical protein
MLCTRLKQNHNAFINHLERSVFVILFYDEFYAFLLRLLNLMLTGPSSEQLCYFSDIPSCANNTD